MPYRQVVLSTGYVEEARVGYLVLQGGDDSLDTIEKTLISVATDLFGWWWYSHGFYSAESHCRCCGHEVDRTAEAFCDEVFSSFSEWLLKLSAATANDLLFLDDLSFVWTPEINWKEIAGVPLEQTVVVHEQAERVLPLFIDATQLEGWAPLSYKRWLRRFGDLEQARADAIEQSVQSDRADLY